MGEYVKVAKTKDIGAGSMKGFVLGEKKVLIANVGGKYYALEDRCPHMGAKLSTGFLMGDTVMCMAHSAQFNVTSGKPASSVTGKPAKIYNIRVNGEDIEVELT